MRIFFFTYRFPYPPISGGQTRALNLIKGISKKHDVTLCSFIKKESELDFESELKKYCSKIITFKRRSLFSPSNLLVSAFSNLPFASALYFSSEVKKSLDKELLEGAYDWVHFESFYPAVYLPNVSKTPTVMGNENVEYLVYERFASNQKPLIREVLKLDSFKMKKFEESLWKKASFNIAVSESDALAVKGVTSKECFVIPNGVDTEFFSESKSLSLQDTLLYVGSFRYIQNQDAIRFFMKDIWPIIKQKRPQTKFLLVGKNPTKEIQNYAGADVEIKDNVEDIREAYQVATALVVPIRAASGTRLKVLEAMASQVPVVSTAVGVEGIEVKHGQEVLIADSPSEFADCVLTLLDDRKLHAKISLGALKVVKDKYSWDKITTKLSFLYSTTSIL